ncbi:nucleoid occlusion protein [Lactobacillus porci]|uniref:Nucleoid occlusion protein n=1 Tax=Lactobacillus porci TaxID=2012477 RepID=A0A6A8MCM7_9LACO|nr:nucleoid occlusion protein [Lactobacillus porci]MDD6415931.1 nucleoid occlusion protein [Lactobacillus porci]MST86771.1 nucleoid occlusion protein [Lactobacillus porci]
MAFGFFHRNEIPKNKQIQDLPLARIHPNRFQPRHAFSSESINELAQTLREEGLLQPIIVREDGEEYEIIAGERRFRAAQSLGWEKIPAIVNNLSDQQTASLALIENLQREDLNPIDEATAYENLMELNSLTQAQLAKDIGKSQSYVANKLRLLKLDPQIQEALASGAITARHGRALLALSSDQQKQALEQILSDKLNVKQTEELVAKLLEGPAKPKEKRKVFRMSHDMRVQINTIKEAVKLAKQSGIKVKVAEQKDGDEYSITIVMKDPAKKKAAKSKKPAVKKED